MSEWITDRRPTEDDGKYVYSPYGNVCLWSEFRDGEPWKPIPKCEPYVKPKKYKVVQFENAEWGVLRIADDKYVAHSIPWNYREAAEEIAAIYEEVMQ